MNNLANLKVNNIPWSNSLELLTNCNLNCIHCYLPNHISSWIPFDVICKQISEMRNLGAFSIILTGGEIFLREDIIDIIKFSRSLCLSTTLFSNASIGLDELKIKKLRDLNIHYFSTTMFSLDPKVHDSITQRTGSLESTMSNIKKLKQYNIRVEVKIPIMKINFNSYYDVIKYCIDNNFSYRIDPNISIKDDGNIDPMNLRISDSELFRVLKNNFTKEEVVNKFNENDYICGNLNSGFHLTNAGDVYPCIGYPKSMGNIYKDSLKNIWNDKNYIKLRNLKNKDYNQCCICDGKDYCIRCPANIYLEKFESKECSPNNCRLSIVRRTYHDE